MADRIRKYGTLVLLAVASLWFICFPVADCFDCEVANAWGRNEHIYNERAIAAIIIFLSFSIIAGILRPRLYWLVPVGITTADVISMHLAGVPWWSVKGNEGPALYIFEAPVGYLALIFGVIIHYMIPKLYSQNSSKTSNNSGV